MEECLIRKHREALPELRSRADNIPTTQPAAAALAAPAEEDSWEMPWPTDEPADPNSPPQGCVICWEDTRLRYDPESAHGPGGLCRTGYWKNDAKKWVSFEFTLNKYEAKLLVSLLDKSPRPTCLSHSGRVRDGVSSTRQFLCEKFELTYDSDGLAVVARLPIPAVSCKISTNLSRLLKNSNTI